MAFHFFRAENRRDIFLHLLIVLLTAAVLIVGFFNVYLPYTTHHGETITVPNLQGMPIDQIEDFLAERDLEFAVDDSTYTPGAQPFTVYQQYPAAGAKVKQHRKIYISINAKNPPMVKMPNLINRSFMNAQRELESVGLLLGKIEYIPDLQEGAVLKQSVNGRDLADGEAIAKGTKIDLSIGDGLGNREVPVPDLKGMLLDEAKELLSGSNLQIGTQLYEKNATVPAGHIIRQKPDPQTKLREGDVVDIWISGEEPALQEEVE